MQPTIIEATLDTIVVEVTLSGPTGPQGIPGPISTSAVSSVNSRTGVVLLTASDVGLANVDNTSDVNKPVSTAASTAIGNKAAIAGQVFTGAISATNLAGTNSGDQTIPTSLPPSGIAGGDLTGSYPGPTLASTANVRTLVQSLSIPLIIALG